jgi:hypothetical protein
MTGEERWSRNKRLLESEIRMMKRDYHNITAGIERLVIKEEQGKIKIYKDSHWDDYN